MLVFKSAQRALCEKQVTDAQKIRAYIMNLQAGTAHCPSKYRSCSSDPRPTLRICTQGTHKHLSGLALSQVTIEPDGRIKACVMYEHSVIWIRIEAEKVRLVSKYCNEMEVGLNEPRLARSDSRGMQKMKPIQHKRNMGHSQNAAVFQAGFSDWYMQEFHSEAVSVEEPEPLIYTPGCMACAVQDRKRHLQRFRKVDLGDGHDRDTRLDMLRRAILSFQDRNCRAKVLSKIDEDSLC